MQLIYKLPVLLLAGLAAMPSAAHAQVFDVDQIGATPNNDADDDGDAIRKAFWLAREYYALTGLPSTVVFGQGGRYVIRSAAAPICPVNQGDAALFLSSGCDPLRDVIVEGNGAEVINEDPLYPTVRMYAAQNVVFRDLTFDIETLPYIGGIVTSVSSTEVRFQGLDGNTDLSYFTDSLSGTPGAGFGTMFAPGNPGIVRTSEMADHFFVQAITAGSGVNEYVLQFPSPRDVSNFQIGDHVTYVIRRKGADSMGSTFNIGNVTGVTFDNIRVAGTGQFAVQGQDCDQLTINALEVSPRPGAMLAANGDGVHLLTAPNTTITDCTFEKLMDDAINLKQDSFGFLISNCTARMTRGNLLRLDYGGATDISESGVVSNNVAQDLSHAFVIHNKGDYSGVSFSNNSISNVNTRLDSSNIHTVASAWGAAFVPFLDASLALTPDSPGTPLAGDSLTVATIGPRSVWDVVTSSGLTAMPGGVDRNGTVLLNRSARRAAPSTWLYASSSGMVSTPGSITATPTQNNCSDEQFWELEPVPAAGPDVVRIKRRSSALYLTYPNFPTSGSSATLETSFSGAAIRRQLWVIRTSTAW